jgi:hypothetical protein
MDGRGRNGGVGAVREDMQVGGGSKLVVYV